MPRNRRRPQAAALASFASLAALTIVASLAALANRAKRSASFFAACAACTFRHLAVCLTGVVVIDETPAAGLTGATAAGVFASKMA